MTFYTIMIITSLSGPLDGFVIGFISYPSEVDCLAALTAVSKTIIEDHNIVCNVTDTVSRTKR